MNRRRFPTPLWLFSLLLGWLLLVPAALAQPCPPAPCYPSGTPAQTQPGQPPSSALQPGATEPVLGAEQAAAFGGETVAVASSAVGYIDSAIPRTEFRFRFDAAYDDNRPDRAEFFYAKCGCFRTAPVGKGFDPNAPGPPKPETSIDYQELSSYLELAVNDRISGFVELPVRFLNPEQNNNASGIGDMNAGFKYAIEACPDRFITFQFRAYFPTGDAGQGLGNDHVTLEPGLLLYQRLSDRLSLEAELKDWIPVDGTDFAGNILRYGVGLDYDAYQTHKLRLTPVLEFVGWTVLGAKELLFPEGITKDASGDTILNLKVGVRATYQGRHSLYAGYGRALTGDVWYKDVLRLEYRLQF
jgi:hypothetical protein